MSARRIYERHAYRESVRTHKHSEPPIWKVINGNHFRRDHYSETKAKAQEFAKYFRKNPGIVNQRKRRGVRIVPGYTNGKKVWFVYIFIEGRTK